ncbi:hypothetical protein D3C75_1137510 [compost metagenome]
MPLERCIFDFPQLDAHPADFHLLVHSAQVFDIPIRHPSSQIACPVHSIAFDPRVRDKFVRCQTGTVHITACDPNSGNKQFAGNSDGLQIILPVNDVQADIVNGFPDRDEVTGITFPGICGAIKPRDLHSGFRRAV